MTIEKLSQLIGKCLRCIDLQHVENMHPIPGSYLNRPVFGLCLADFDDIYSLADDGIFKSDPWNMIFNRMGTEFLIFRNEEIRSGTVEVSFVVPFDEREKNGKTK